MRRVALAAALIALAAAGLGTAVGLPASSTRSSTPLTITIAPPSTTAAPAPADTAALLSLFAAGKAETLDVRLRQPVETLLASRPSLARELGLISGSPAAEAVVLLAVLDIRGEPLMSAIAPLVSRMAYDAARVKGARSAGELLSIEILARAAAVTQGARP